MIASPRHSAAHERKLRVELERQLREAQGCLGDWSRTHENDKRNMQAHFALRLAEVEQERDDAVNELTQVGWQLDAARKLLALADAEKMRNQGRHVGHCPKCDFGAPSVKKCVCLCHSPPFDPTVKIVVDSAPDPEPDCPTPPTEQETR